MIDRDSSEEEVNHSSISVKAVEKNEENKKYFFSGWFAF